jgi:hypothetical protein
MGYKTIDHVKRCFTYADAKYVHDKTTPIRGRSPEVRPLGQRRDAGVYSVRMSGANVEFVLYKTPVITYLPNGDVVIKTDGWNSMSTHQFIEQVLGVKCYGARRNTVMEARSAEGDVHKYIIPKDKGITMIHAGGNWRITQFNTIYEYRLNRKAANAVRKQYGDFLRYVKGMVNLRSEMVEPSRWARRQKPYAVINVTGNEVRGSTLRVNDLVWGLMELIKLEQSEETRHENHNAALAMVLRHCNQNQYGQDAAKVPADEVPSLIDELLLRAHAQEVLVWTELKVGQVPSGKYKGWMPERT